MKSGSEDRQKHFQERTKVFQEKIQDFIKKEAEALEECRKDPQTAAVKLYYLANDMLDLTSHYIVISGVSRAVLNERDAAVLNEARKTVFKALIYLENIVTRKVDAQFSEYEKNLAEIESIDIDTRYRLVLKIGFTISLLIQAYGDNTKWKWSFVDIEGRYAVIAKNLFDMKAFYSQLSLDSPHYATTVAYLDRLKKLLNDTADRYHERFEIATQRPEDLMSAINLLRALHRICAAMNEKDDAEQTKKKYLSLEAAYDYVLKKAREKQIQKDA
ncbi:MAG: hypothetical protein LBT01_06725 [Spirochaetaceae bacterium]|jgi:hypothetical protein|nr:hypothetical protein [Spirochaetaceae bacterium]